MSAFTKAPVNFPENTLVRWVGGRTVFRVVSTPRSQMVAMVRADGQLADDITITAARNVVAINAQR